MTETAVLPTTASHRPRTTGPSRRALRALLRWGLPLLVLAAVVAAATRSRFFQSKPTIRYETVGVDRGAIAARVTATGAVSALVTVLVGSQVSGRIESLKADFGTTVTRGQTIATIEPSFFRAAVSQGRATLAAARTSIEKAKVRRVLTERQLARARGLAGEGLMTRAELELAEAESETAAMEIRAAEAAAAQARAALDQAELSLKYTTIVSPIDGVVISRNVDVGQTVAATLQAPTLFTIAQDLTRMQVDTNVAEADVGKIRPGMPVTFTVDAYPHHTFRGTVRQLRDNAQTIQNVVTYDAVIDVNNDDRLLKPGMTASVSFTHDTVDDALRLPNAALRFKPDARTTAAMGGRAPGGSLLGANQRSVWVLRDGKPSQVVVKLGLSDGALSQVLEGDLREGDRVITEAFDQAGKGP